MLSFLELLLRYIWGQHILFILTMHSIYCTITCKHIQKCMLIITWSPYIQNTFVHKGIKCYISKAVTIIWIHGNIKQCGIMSRNV